MALFLELYLGHVLGDFLLQPGRLVIAKRDGIPGLMLHTLIVGISTLAVLVGSLNVDWAPAVLVTGLHLVIERITITTYLRTPTRGLFTFLMDQAMHALSIALVVWVAGRSALTATATVFGFTVSIVTLAGICALATVTLFGSILVFETVNAVLGEQKGRLLRLDGARIYGIAERGAALALALIHPALMIAPFLPRLVWALTGGRGERSRQIVEAATGFALCVFGYAGVAAVSYLVYGRDAADLILSVGFAASRLILRF